MRALARLLLCLFPLTASAIGTADVAVTSLTAAKTSAISGEPVVFTIHLKNHGPEEALDVNLNLLNSYSATTYVLSATATSGWQCSPIFPNCFTQKFPAGAEVQLELRLLVPAAVYSTPLTMTAHLSSANEINIANNSAQLTIALQPSSWQADLSLRIDTLPNPVPHNIPLSVRYDVRNDGPQNLADVKVRFYFGTSLAGLQLSGDGWTCTMNPPNGATCSRAALAAGSESSLTLGFTTPSAPLELELRAEAFAVQTHLDANLFNNRAWHTFFIGEAGKWSRLLVPLTKREVPGAGGSLWKTEVSGVILSNSPIVTEPTGCGGLEDPCALPPLNRLFDAHREELVYDSLGPQFVYVHRTDASKLRFASRVYDASKSGQTAGAFVPIARDDDFAEEIAIIGIPVAPQYRSMLRLYDYAGVEERVEILFYGDDANT
ncbi:MAG TPA: hypothetical protein VFO89_16825, partial [Thermoanaerobaculia bacterium]|nr:hypothetical protein [Thermoanaerobaculia bacterium]